MGKKYDELASLTSNLNVDRSAERRSDKIRTAPGQVVEFAVQRDAAERRAEEAEARLAELEQKLQASQGTGQDIALDLLVEVPGRRRKLTGEEYEHLKHNLTHYPLASPITVRKLPDGNFEIVSGNNRAAIYRELGRQTIKAWVADTADVEEAEDLAFFANAIVGKHTDYEKYLGYERFLRKHPNLEQKELAHRVGISEALLSRLLAFRDLPQEAHSVLTEMPQLLGSTSAQSLAKLNKAGKGAAVVSAITKLANGELATEGDAVRVASEVTTQKQKANEQTYRIGKVTYAKVRAVGKTLRIDFTDETEREEVQAALKAVIDSRIAKLKGSS